MLDLLQLISLASFGIGVGFLASWYFTRRARLTATKHTNKRAW